MIHEDFARMHDWATPSSINWRNRKGLARLGTVKYESGERRKEQLQITRVNQAPAVVIELINHDGVTKPATS